MKLLLRLGLLLIATIHATASYAQLSYHTKNNNGVVRGYVIDRSTGKGVTNAYVELLNYHPTISTATDDEGYFELERVPVGHQRLHVVRNGYYEAIQPQLVVAGKEAVLSIPLEEQLQMVVVTVEGTTSGSKKAHFRNTKQETIDQMNAVSARPLNMEETDKYVGGYNDPSRELTNFAGQYNYTDIENHVVSRGNSPYGFQFLVEGVPVDNISHLANLSSTGGFLPLINANLLDNSDFANGVLSAQYGNAYAGVLDANLRGGNNQRREHTLQVGLFGLEGSAEGPFKKGGGSYNVAARVGLFSLLQDVGVDFGTTAATEYYDLNAKIVLPTRRAGTFSAFAIGGYSRGAVLGVVPDSAGPYTGLPRSSYFKGHTVLAGLSHRVFLNQRSSLKTTLSYWRQHYDTHRDSLYPASSARIRQLDQAYDRYGFQSVFNTKPSNRLLLRLGVQGFLHHYDLSGRNLLEQTRYLQHHAFQWQAHAFAQAQYKFSKQWSATVGVQAMYWDLNARTWSVEPRLSLNWDLHACHRLALGYGWHSRVQPAFLHYYVAERADGGYNRSNTELGPTRSHQGVLSYDWMLSKQWTLSSSLYAQYQTNIPVEQTPSSFSMANYEADGFSSYRTDLENTGLAYNYGVEMTLERFFFRGYYGLVTGSYQRAFYQGSDQVWRNSSFDVQYIGSLLAGRELKIGPNRRNVLYADLRFNVRGGNPYMPVDVAASSQAGHTIYETERAYEERLPSYQRLDLRVGMRFNHSKARISHNFYLEVINVTNATNYRSTVYDPVTADIARRRQVGFFPNFLYQIRF